MGRVSERQKRRLLVLDNDADVRRLFEFALGLYDWEVRATGTVAEAVGWASWADAATVDLNLGGPDPRQLVTQLRTSNRQLRVVIVSGDSHDRDLAIFHADAFVLKPFDVPAIAQLLDRMLWRLVALQRDIAIFRRLSFA